MATDNSAESEKYLTLAIKAEPAYAEPRILRGILYSSTRRFKKALADLDAAILIDPHDARIYAEKGHVYLHLKNFARAEANLKTALQLDPELLSALMDLARVRWAGHKDAGGAVVYLRSAVSAGMDAAQVIAAAEDKADMLSGLAETPQFASVFAKK
jgi:tetratricopeptide (TPR) repeat protein